MDLLKKYEYILIFIKLGLAIPVCLHYVSIVNEYDLVHVPTYIWILVLLYTAIQFLNKQVQPQIPIHISVFYYMGLLSIALPVFLVDRFEKVDWLIVSKVGCWFLLISILLQMRSFMSQKNNVK
jgi:hypothetical protein